MRLKIIAGNLVAVLLLGLVSYVVVGSDLRTHLAKEVQAQIGNDQAAVERSLRLTALELVDLVKARAATGDVRAVFTALDEQGRRTRAFDAAERSAAWFGDPARGSRGNPDIVLITDEVGKVMARNADRNRLYGTRLDTVLPALRAALADGEARHDVWKKDDEGKLLEIAVAPLRDRGNIVGALVVGFDFSNGLAQSEGKRLGDREVAFIVDDKVYSSSLPETTAKQLKGYLIDGDGLSATKQALGGAVSSPWLASLEGNDYVGVVAPLPEAHSSRVAYAVLANRSAGAAIVGDSTKIILALTVILALVVLGYGFMIGNSIVRPIEEIEEGVLSIINGNTDLRLETSNPDLGGLAYRINQLLNVFTGVSEADEEDEQGRVSLVRQEAWKDSEFGDGQGAAGGGGGAAAGGDPIDDPALASRLSAEPEDAYYKRVFQDYVTAKKAAGETVNIPEDRFTQRLKGNEAALIQKHGVKAVRFQVTKGGGLQPVLIR
jgi:hypothetical protein